MSARVRSWEARRWLSRLLLVLAALLMVATGTLAWQTYAITRQLDDRVRVTQDLADGNVRTLGQVQRELLRLENLLEQPRPRLADVRLQRALAAQRVQEAALSLQVKALGSDALLEQSRALRRRWEEQINGLVIPSAQEPRTGTMRTTVIERIADLELQYNQLVSAGENQRKVRAADSNDTVATLLVGARTLLLALALTTLLMLAYAGFTLWGVRRLDQQRARAAAALVETNRDLQRHAFVVRSTDNMVVLTDEHKRIEWVNDAFTRATGWTLEDMVGKSPGQVLQGPGTDPETIAFMRERLAAGEAFRTELLNYTRSGEEIWVALEVNPVRDDRDRLTGFVALQTDITERRAAEQHLRAAKDAAEASARDKAAFLASMSHEIRTPLNAVLGLNELLLLTTLDAQQREYLETAQNSGQMLLAVVNDILDFSALESGSVETEMRPFTPERLLRDVRNMFLPQAQQRGLTIRTGVDDAVPPALVGDETRLRQVLVNLVGNAIKFTEHGEVGIEVCLDETADVDENAEPLVLRVRDTGIGIPASRRDRLFQPFSQVDSSTTRKFGGTGLGLAICKALVEQMGGTIDVTSVEGQGSTFTVRLDLPVADAADLRRQQSPGDDTVPAMTVLLAEDDPVNQTVVGHMLRRLGIEPEIVADGAAAVAGVARLDPDVVLMDMHMPVMDGIEACRRIIETRQGDRPRVVAVTANALPGDRERFLAAGFDDYVSKPLRIDTLVAVLRRAAGVVVPDAGPAEPTQAVLPVIDTEEFTRRLGIDDPALLQQMVGLLLDQLATSRSDVTALLAKEDFTGVADFAHRLRGSALAVGATRLAAATGALEDLAGQRKQPASGLLDDIDAQRAALRAWLDQEQHGTVTH